MDIYEKIKAGEVISDSDFATCGETPLDIFRFFEKELKGARNKAKKRLLDKLSLIQEREELKKATMTLAEGLNFQQERADKLEQECERLKNQYNCYACDTCKGQEDYKNIKRHCKNAIKSNHKYKQALDEIKKFAKENVELLEGYHLEQANCLTILEIIKQAKGGK